MEINRKEAADEINWNMVQIEFQYEKSYKGDFFNRNHLHKYEVKRVQFKGEDRPDLCKFIEEYLKE